MNNRPPQTHYFVHTLWSPNNALSRNLHTKFIRKMQRWCGRLGGEQFLRLPLYQHQTRPQKNAMDARTHYLNEMFDYESKITTIANTFEMSTQGHLEYPNSCLRKPKSDYVIHVIDSWVYG